MICFYFVSLTLFSTNSSLVFLLSLSSRYFLVMFPYLKLFPKFTAWFTHLLTPVVHCSNLISYSFCPLRNFISYTLAFFLLCLFYYSPHTHTIQHFIVVVVCVNTCNELALSIHIFRDNNYVVS